MQMHACMISIGSYLSNNQTSIFKEIQTLKIFEIRMGILFSLPPLIEIPSPLLSDLTI